MDLRSMLSVAYEKGNDEEILRAKKIFGNDLTCCKSIISKLSPYAGINYLIKGAGYGKYLHRLSKGNVLYEQELLRNLDQVKLLFSEIRTREAFFEMDDSETEKEQECTDSRVGLYTFHGSKGLEFDHVMILDVNEGITPSARAEDDSLEEERRMFYVAMTRAKSSLAIITVDRRNGKKMYPSRFITEMQEET